MPKTTHLKSDKLYTTKTYLPDLLLETAKHKISQYLPLFYCLFSTSLTHTAIPQNQFNNDILEVITRIPDGDKPRELKALDAMENRIKSGEDVENRSMVSVTNLARAIFAGERGK